TGRIPLYRLKESFKDMDTELILGKSINPERFDDTNLGRAMDKIYETGAQNVFSQISQNAIGCFKLNTSGYHFDTTSVSVFGDYDCEDSSLKITYGHSKAKRPDLKQFMVSMLCVDRNIPIIGKTEDGNSSDKTLNNKLLSNVSAYMAKYGVDSGAAIYVADSAFVTEKNIAKAEEKKICFLSRFPANFKECGRVIREAVDADNWEEIGAISKGAGSKKRPPAHYRAFDSNVTVDGKSHRAVVIHSSAHDRRRQKRIDRMLKTDKANLDKKIKEITKTPFQCRPDADAAAAGLIHMARKSLHQVSVEVSEIPRFGRGRPKIGETRTPKSFDYSLIVKVEENPEKTEELRLEAGCFVLITNEPVPKPNKGLHG
ncbi:MAG: IS1634 family transposase, partial [Desulfobulbaceae bacterium]|nr:IS1634 family transposase [Desulfobulbaceae bacterium]